MVTSDTSGCPGGCLLAISRRALCCDGCWVRLPVEIRDRLDRALRGRPGGGGYEGAARAALSWLGDNPAHPLANGPGAGTGYHEE